MSVFISDINKSIINSNLTFIIANTGHLTSNIFKATTFQYISTGNFSITNNLTGSCNINNSSVYKGSQFTSINNNISYEKGNVGIKVYNPSKELEVNGSIQSTNLYITTGSIGLGMSEPMYQLDLSTDNARKLTTTTWLTGSDERVKNNIEDADLDICYDIVKNLKLKRFRWKEDFYPVVEDRHNVGFIAQEVETIFPKAVVKNKQKFNNDIVYEDFRNLNTDQIYKSLFGATQKIIKNIENNNKTEEQNQNQFIKSNINYIILNDDNIRTYFLSTPINGNWHILTNLTNNLVDIKGNFKQYSNGIYKLEPNKSIWVHSDNIYWFIVNF